MGSLEEIEKRIEAAYPELGPQLRRAARFVLRAPAEIALYPLRSVAERAEVAPTTLVRLAEQIGFGSYKAFRDAFRDTLRSGAGRYATGAEQLVRQRARGGFEVLYRDAGDILAESIRTTFAMIPAQRVEEAGRALARARRIYLLGMRSNYSPAFYFHYVMRTFTTNVFLLEDRLGMLIDELGEIGAKDVLLVISYEPYALNAVKAVDYARDAGACIVALTDSTVSPVAARANHLFVVPTTSTSFYQSMIPTIALLESFVCYLAAKGGQKTVQRVKDEFARREGFGVYWVDGRHGNGREALPGDREEATGGETGGRREPRRRSMPRGSRTSAARRSERS
ncbi:MAG: MurR/RpiR family transcriptional regulator [Rhodospirillales bacterium]|nr:MurR/RpiR family transcriptional regulator [Rhodospirillales bacterium]